ncbi:MAG TPA: hypothetical protein VN706_15970 [Gemmatimonadaceae bacterium]|jgi:hypothetical protein|nr:hypothetical protein [Gemmatimonadaceae bacterium]
MSNDNTPKGTNSPSTPSDRKRVAPSDPSEVTDEALESVAGGCEIGCSANSCADMVSLERPTFLQQFNG